MGIRVLNIIFPILTGTYVARVLDLTDYGYFNSVDTILSFFLPFATYGVYNYGLRAISNVKDNKKILIEGIIWHHHQKKCKSGIAIVLKHIAKTDWERPYKLQRD